MLLALQERWLFSMALIWSAALFDTLDGRVARRLNATRPFGRELDGLADLISFGLAPAVLFYLLLFEEFNWSGVLAAGVFPLCGALRLVRFPAADVKNYYVGLPLAAAGPLLAGVSFFGSRILPAVWQEIILLVLAGLMVSTIRLPKK